MLTLNLALRVAVVTLLALTTLLLLRDARAQPDAQARNVVRLAAAFALGVAAHALHVLPGLAGTTPWWHGPVSAIEAGNAIVFWLLARALFDDGFALQAWHAVIWAMLAALSVHNCLVLIPTQAHTAAPLVSAILSAVGLVFATLAVLQTIADWRGDLVEGRRRIRVRVVAIGAGYAVFNLALRLSQPSADGLPGLPDLANTADIAVLLGLVFVVVSQVLQTNAGVFATRALSTPPNVTADEQVERIASGTDEQRELVEQLEHLMAIQKVYREEGLAIGALAQRMGIPEYRLRRLINQQLGHRNFTAFLNSYRLDETKTALADAERTSTPILTIALSAGFQSIGPFNRAFKADTGQTPSAFRAARATVSQRQSAAVPPRNSADSEIG